MAFSASLYVSPNGCEELGMKSSIWYPFHRFIADNAVDLPKLPVNELIRYTDSAHY